VIEIEKLYKATGIKSLHFALKRLRNNISLSILFVTVSQSNYFKQSTSLLDEYNVYKQALGDFFFIFWFTDFLT